MKVWELKSDDKVGIATINRERDYKEYFEPQFLGQPLEKWKEIDMHIYKGKGKVCDSFYFIHGKLIWSKKASDLLSPVIKEAVEVLPINLEDFPVVAINVINVIDAINYDEAVEDRLSNGAFIGFKSYAFHTDRLQGEYIFKIPEQLSTKVFVTDAFKVLVESKKLKGFLFREVWDSEMVLFDPLTIFVEEFQYSDDTTEYTYEEAMAIVEQGEWAVIHGNNKWQTNDKGELILGERYRNGEFVWIKPIYIPIPHLELKWRKSLKTKSPTMIK